MNGRRVLFAACLLCCCSEAPEFAVRDVRPEASAGPLRLNEPLSIQFNADVDPSSVSPRSVRVATEDGAPVEGRLEAQGARVTFRPDPVSSAGLDDGGYAPGKRVELRLDGFPSRTGVRAADGRPLARAFHEEFHVVEAAAQPASGLPFLDPQPGAAPEMLGMTLDDGWIRLTFSEPLWPASVNPDTVRLRYDDPDRTPVQCDVRLLQGFDHAEVMVRPAGGFIPGTTYIVDVAGGRLLDLGGTSGAPMPGPHRVTVDPVSGALRLGDPPPAATGMR